MKQRTRAPSTKLERGEVVKVRSVPKAGKPKLTSPSQYFGSSGQVGSSTRSSAWCTASSRTRIDKAYGQNNVTEISAQSHRSPESPRENVRTFSEIFRNSIVSNMSYFGEFGSDFDGNLREFRTSSTYVCPISTKLARKSRNN